VRLNQRRTLSRRYAEKKASDWLRDCHRERCAAAVLEGEGFCLCYGAAREIDLVEIEAVGRYLELAHRRLRVGRK
jgi:hypothetical protein